MTEIETLQHELETLRRTNAELVTKNSSRKARIAELETANSDIQMKLAAANATIHEFTIGAPLKAMAEEISNCPELWIEQFSKSYRLQPKDGEQSIVSIADGQPLMRNGNPVPFERAALAALLTENDHPQANVFRAITIASRASGAASSGGSTLGSKAPQVAGVSPRQFGLR